MYERMLDKNEKPTFSEMEEHYEDIIKILMQK